MSLCTTWLLHVTYRIPGMIAATR